MPRPSRRTHRPADQSLARRVRVRTDRRRREAAAHVLAMVAEFESDLTRLRTVEGMKVAKVKGPPEGQAAPAEPKTAHF